MPVMRSIIGSIGIGLSELETNSLEARTVVPFSFSLTLSSAGAATSYVFFFSVTSTSIFAFFLYFVFVLYLPRGVFFDFLLSRMISVSDQRTRLPAFRRASPENHSSLYIVSMIL